MSVNRSEPLKNRLFRKYAKANADEGVIPNTPDRAGISEIRGLPVATPLSANAVFAFAMAAQ